MRRVMWKEARTRYLIFPVLPPNSGSLVDGDYSMESPESLSVRQLDPPNYKKKIEREKKIRR